MKVHDCYKCQYYALPCEVTGNKALCETDKLDKIIAYEDGTLSDDDTIKLFQELIDSGEAWTLQGSYGRMARALILGGWCHETK